MGFITDNIGGFILLGIGIFTLNPALIVGGLISIGLSVIFGPESPNQTPDRGITQIIRASDEPHKIIWGERPVSGVLSFVEITDWNEIENGLLHIVLALTGHQCQEINTVFFNDVGVDADQIDGNGNVTSGPFEGHLKIIKHLGLDDQAADAVMVAGLTDWSTDHRLRGITYIYCRLAFNRNVWPTGIPNIKAMIKGRLVADPRDTAIVITSSSIADPSTILTASPHGLVAGDRCFISSHTGAVPDVIGEYQVLSAPTTTTITIDENVTTGGTGGSLLQMKWSENSALCLRDYLLADFGLDEDQADGMDDVAAVAAANICDEDVLFPSGINPFDFTVDAATDILTQTAAAGIKPEPLHPHDRVRLTTSDTLPAGLALATDYYMITISGKEEPFTFKLASSLVNARAALPVTITDTGTGTHTLTRLGQLRYTTNGIISLGDDPVVIAPDLITAMAGQLTYTQGKYLMYAGAYKGPATAATFNEDSLRGSITVRARPGKAEIHNSVRGTFIDRDNRFLSTDFPPVVNATYVTADKGEKIFKDINYRHVTDTHRAQRLAVLKNVKDREGLVASYPANLTMLEVAVGDVIDISNDRLGWTDKEFEILEWKMVEDGGIDLVLKETSSAIYSFNPETDETILDLAPNTNLPKAFTVPDTPSNLVLASGSGTLFLETDGTIVPRIKATWTAIDDINVLSGGRIEIQTKKSADVDWDDMVAVLGDATQAFLSPVDAGVEYDVRIRVVNKLRLTSSYITVSAHVVLGKSAAPADVENFSSQQNNNVVVFKWNQVADLDLAGYEIRYLAI